MAKSESNILKSYRQAVFNRGTIVSTAQTVNSLPLSTISLSIDMGSRYEHPEIQGLTHFMTQSLLRSTNNRLTGALHRDMAKLGVELSAECNREQVVITANIPSERITPIIGTMFDILLHHTFDIVDLRTDMGFYAQNFRKIEHNNYVQFQEILHKSAFGSSTIGNSLYPITPSNLPDSIVPKITSNLLKTWSKQFFTGNRISISAVNVNHNTFMQTIEENAHRLPGSTLGNFPTPKTAYVAKEAHLVHPDILQKTRGVETATQYVNYEDYTGNPMDYIVTDDHIEQHIGVAYLAPDANHTDSAATHVINSMLSTGLIYPNHSNWLPINHRVGAMYNTQKTHQTHSPFDTHILPNPLKIDINQQYDIKGLYNNNGRSIGGYGTRNHLLQYRNDHGFSPFLKSIDSNYQIYNDSGLLQLHSVIPTTSTAARMENIGFMQLAVEALSSSTVSNEKMIQFHKDRVLFGMQKYFSSQNNIAKSLATSHTQRQFAHRMELLEGGKSTNSIELGKLKWNAGINHDPIDQLYAAISKVTPEDVRMVVDKIIQSPPTIISYTAPVEVVTY
jgi:predicted Zn-dependent peptidase